MRNKMISVIIADDHAIIRRGLKQILSETSDIQFAGEAADGPQTLCLARSEVGDVLVLDINMPGRGGLDILSTVKQEQPDLPVLVLSIHPEDQYALRCLRAGAAGYLTKDSAPEQLVSAIRQVATGGSYISSHLGELLAQRVHQPIDRPRYETLSDREFQVMSLMGAGGTPTEIASDLSLSVKTISTYRSRILSKLDLKTSAEIIQYAFQNHLIPTE